MDEYIELIAKTLKLDLDLLLKKKIRGLPGITGYSLIKALLKHYAFMSITYSCCSTSYLSYS